MGLTWIEPTGLISLAVKAMRTGRAPTEICIASQDVSSYVQRMGLYGLLGLPCPRVRHSYSAGSRFVELSLMDLRTRPDAASALCTKIACVMAQGDSRLEDLFAYILGELTANVRQHAGAPGLVMAQHYPSDGSVEFAIGDWGIGIRAGLAENPAYVALEERESLEMATRPNTSGKDWAGAPGYGERQNSGNGLFHLSFLAKEAPGRFLLVSGGQALYIHGTATYSKALKCSFPGTLVSLRFQPGAMNLNVLLAEASKVRGLTTQDDDLVFE